MIFGRRLIFDKINYQFSPGKVYGLAGRNGSGKSTLAKIIDGLLTPTRGKVLHKLNGKDIPEIKIQDNLGFVSPYLVLYDEFTAWENLEHLAKIRGLHFDEECAAGLLKDFGIHSRRNDLLKGYSSGMKQRMKFIFSLLHDPPLLIFDEPTSNLDTAGKQVVYDTIRREAESKIVILASNEENDLEFCDEIIEVEKYKADGAK